MRCVWLQGWAVEPGTFRIFYCTGWDEAVLEYRRIGPNGERQKVRASGAATGMVVRVRLHV